MSTTKPSAPGCVPASAEQHGAEDRKPLTSAEAARVDAAEGVLRLEGQLAEVQRKRSEARGLVETQELMTAERQIEEDLRRARNWYLETRRDVEREKRAKTSAWYEPGIQVLREYAEKLDRTVQAVLTIWDRLGKLEPRLIGEPQNFHSRGPDPVQKAAMKRLLAELDALTGPLREWITRMSALLEEGRLTEPQRLELLLRLTDLESKYHTATVVVGQFSGTK